MSDVKQVVVVRKDLQWKRGKLASQVAQAAMQFLLDNNEAERNDEVVIRLTPAEASWLSGSFSSVVVGVDSEDALRNLIFRAQLADIEVHPTFAGNIEELEEERDDDDSPKLTCAAFGPCEAEDIDKLTGHLRAL